MFANKENVIFQAPQARTPGPGKMNTRTPFKVPLNDENMTSTLHPKTGGKNLFAGKDPSLFVTPVGPRRKALAGKTTNVKARNLAPPARQEKQQDLNLKSQRTQLTVSEQAEPALRDPNNEIPEIEYMAPVPAGLPYIPDGFKELDYGSLKKSYMKGCHRAFLAGIDENGKTEIQRNTEKSWRMLEADLDAETEEILYEAKGFRQPKQIIKAPTSSGTISNPKTRHTGSGTSRKASEVKRPVLHPTVSSRPASAASITRPTSATSITRPTSSSQRRANTPDSRRAAEMLSQRPASSSSVTRPESRHSRHTSTVAAPAKKPLSFSNKQAVASTNRSHSRSTSISATVASSRSTIGYNAGRKVGESVKKIVTKAKLESTLDAIERIQRQDEESDMGLTLPMGFVPEEDAEDDVIVEFPSPLVDEEFFMILPQ